MTNDDPPDLNARHRGRPAKLKEPVFFRVRFEKEKLKEYQEFCEARGLAFTEFCRKAVARLYKEAKG